MKRPTVPVLLVAAIAVTGFALSACHKKQASPGQQMKQGANEMGAGAVHAASKAGQVIADSAITTKIKGQLAADQGLSGFGIHVETNGGIVTLSGTVNNKSERDRAEQIASATGGVRGVNNNIKVVPES